MNRKGISTFIILIAIFILGMASLISYMIASKKSYIIASKKSNDFAYIIAVPVGNKTKYVNGKEKVKSILEKLGDAASSENVELNVLKLLGKTAYDFWNIPKNPEATTSYAIGGERKAIYYFTSGFLVGKYKVEETFEGRILKGDFYPNNQGINAIKSCICEINPNKKFWFLIVNFPNLKGANGKYDNLYLMEEDNSIRVKCEGGQVWAMYHPDKNFSEIFERSRVIFPVMIKFFDNTREVKLINKNKGLLYFNEVPFWDIQSTMSGQPLSIASVCDVDINAGCYRLIQLSVILDKIIEIDLTAEKSQGPITGQATKVLLSHPPCLRELYTVFTESFNDFSNWDLYGHPKPTIKNGAFLSNGDSWCQSEAVTKMLFDFSKGGEVEFRAKLSTFSQHHHMGIDCFLTNKIQSDGYCKNENWVRIIGITIIPPNDKYAGIHPHGFKKRFPYPDDNWHKYKIRIEPSGNKWFVKYYLDGKEFFSGYRDFVDLSSVRICVSGRSLYGINLIDDLIVRLPNIPY